MGIFSFKSTPKPRRFNHVPIYWNPEKEKLDEIKSRYSTNEDGEEYKIGIQRGSFRKYADRVNLGKNKVRNQKMMYRLIFALIVLLLLGLYLIINGNALISLYFDNGL
jgi:hypothetical protein